MKKVLKITGIVVLILIALIVIGVILLFVIAAVKPMVPSGYTDTVITGGKIEAKYLKNGTYDVEYFEVDAPQNFKKYEIWYPAEMLNGSKKFPVIVVSNGTGVKASKAKAMFEHFASWGFIVVGTEEEYSWNGFSAEMSLKYLLKCNDNKESIFYQKVDTDNIGSVGHSQGGVGAINAVTDTKHGYMYKTVVAESPANIELAESLEWNYDISKVNIPIMLTAGTGKVDSQTIIPIDKLNEMYNLVTQAPIKVMARRNGLDHGEILYSVDGYVTAWFMWQLQGDSEAAKAFIGDNPEIDNNDLYVDVRIDSGI